MKRFAAIYNGTAAHHRTLHDERFAAHLAGHVYLPELATADLSEYDGIVVPDRLHRRLLNDGRHRLLEILDRGGTVILFGEQSAVADEPVGWLPGLRWEHRPTDFWWWLQPGADSGLRASQPDHSLWRYLTLTDATWHQHGVYHPPPGTDVLVRTVDGAAVLYIDDKVSSPGTLVVASLDPMYHFGSYFMPATERFLCGFFPWMTAEL